MRDGMQVYVSEGGADLEVVGVQISPCDERCHAGEVTIRPDAQGQFPQISGELFTVRRVMLPQSAGRMRDSTSNA